MQLAEMPEAERVTGERHLGSGSRSWVQLVTCHRNSGVDIQWQRIIGRREVNSVHYHIFHHGSIVLFVRT